MQSTKELSGNEKHVAGDWNRKNGVDDERKVFVGWLNERKGEKEFYSLGGKLNYRLQEVQNMLLGVKGKKGVGNEQQLFHRLNKGEKGGKILLDWMWNQVIGYT